MGVSPTSLRLGTFLGVTTSKDRLAQARSIADRVARDFGLEIFDVQLRRESIGWVLRIFIDKVVQSDMTTETNNSEAVTVEDCQRVSTDVSAVLDAEFSFEHNYTLEVSSPGLDRPLIQLAHFERFKGHEARIETSTAIDGSKHFSGRLGGVKGNNILMHVKGDERILPFTDIEKAKLIITDEIFAKTEGLN